MEILDGAATEKRLKEMFAQCTKARIAVAFWGAGAIERLGLAALAEKDAEIVCDLMSGCCNPTEIASLMTLFPDRIFMKRGLHAKVWISDAGCVLGSSNASANGFGHEGDELTGQTEANLAFAAGSDATEDWEAWYIKCAKGEAELVTQKHLEEAHRLWEKRRRERDAISPFGATTNSLYTKLISNAAYFSGKSFQITIFKHEDMDSKAEKLLANEQKRLGDTHESPHFR